MILWKNRPFQDHMISLFDEITSLVDKANYINVVDLGLQWPNCSLGAARSLLAQYLWLSGNWPKPCPLLPKVDVGDSAAQHPLQLWLSPWGAYPSSLFLSIRGCRLLG